MINFEYRVVIIEHPRKARAWCKEEFGEIPIIHKTINGRNKETGKRYYRNLGRVYDIKNARWLQRSQGRSNPNAFYFKEDSDAVMVLLLHSQ